MKHVNQNDDLSLQLKLTDATGAIINPADYSFTLKFYTRRHDVKVLDVVKGDPLPSGVTFDGTNVLIELDAPGFAPGEIILESLIQIPSSTQPDQIKTISSGDLHTNIYVDSFCNEKVSKCGCGCLNVEVSFYDYIQEAHEAAEEANAAAQEANQAASAATDAAASANSAASAANSAADSANTAAENANTAAGEAAAAAGSATSAASSATSAANSANSAAQAADTATEAANTAAGSANTAATNATSATTEANTAATNASNAATVAETAASSANSATSTANSATDSANTAAENANTAAGAAGAAAGSATSAASSANAAANAATTAAQAADAATTAATDAADSANTAAERADAAAESVEEYETRLATAETEIRQLKRDVAALQATGKVIIGFYRVRDNSSPVIEYIYDENEERLYDLFRTGLVNDKGIVSAEFAPCSLSKSVNGDPLSIDGSMGDVMQFTKGEIYAIMGRNVGELKVWLYSNQMFVYRGIEAHKFARHARGIHYGVVDRNTFRHVYNKTIRGSYRETYGFAEQYCDGYGYPTRSISQYNGMLYNRNKNADTTRNFPFMLPMTWMQDIRAGMIYHEAKTMNLTDPALFGSGMTTSQTASLANFDDEICTAIGGVKITLNGNSTVVGFSTTLFQVDAVDRYMIAMLTYDGGMGLECMEGQRVLAYAYENKIEEGVHFSLPDQSSNIEYKYRSAPNCKGLQDGIMTGVVFKYVKMTTLSDDSVTIKAANAALGLSAGDPVNGAEVVFQMPIPIYRGENVYGERFVQHVGLGLVCHNELPPDNPLIDTYGANYYEIFQTYDWRKVPVYTNTTLATYRTDGSLFDEEKDYEHVGYMPRGEEWAKETFDGCPLITEVRGGARTTYEGLCTWLSGTTTEGRKENKAFPVGCNWYHSYASVRTVHGPYSVTSGHGTYVGSSAVPDLSLSEEEEIASRL